MALDKAVDIYYTKYKVAPNMAQDKLTFQLVLNKLYHGNKLSGVQNSNGKHQDL